MNTTHTYTHQTPKNNHKSYTHTHTHMHIHACKRISMTISALHSKGFKASKGVKALRDPTRNNSFFLARFSFLDQFDSVQQ